jgi:hypothetical protein
VLTAAVVAPGGWAISLDAMAARRLLIIMLVLLGVSTLAAALVGNRTIGTGGTDSAASTAATETEPAIPPDTVPEGRRLKPVVIEVDKAKRTVVPVELGDQLPLIVRSPKPDLVEIPALGLLEPVNSNAPARFDVFADTTGDYGIRLVDANRIIGRIEVTAPKQKD